MANPLHIGSIEVPDIYIGDTPISDVYFGNISVFSKGPFTGLKLSPKNVGIEKTGGTFNLIVRSSEDWTLSMDSTYLSASSYSGTTADTAVTITVVPNTGETDITSVITATTANYTATCEVNINGLDWSKQYLTFNIKSDGNIVWTNSGMTTSSNRRTIYYSLNDGAWTQLPTSTTSFNVVTGDVVRFKGTYTSYASSWNKAYTFSGSTADFDVCGNINSLVLGDNFVDAEDPTIANYGFTRMFMSTNVIDASNLILNSKTANQSKYQSLFNRCSKLTKAPDLIASALSTNDYTAMFDGCSNLSFIRCYAMNPISSLDTNQWTKGVAATGTFVKKTGSSWTTGIDGIPSGWTVIEE